MQHRRFMLLVLLLAVVPAAAGEPRCERIVAVGDVHGGAEQFESILAAAGIVDEEGRWAGAGACLVQVGDLVDRGRYSRQAMDLIRDLEAQAPGRVFSLLGNHEVLTLVSDLRYAMPGEFFEFAGDESGKDRRRGLEWFRSLPRARDLGRKELRDEFDKSYPPGWIARWEAFRPEGEYGAWLLDKPTVLLLDGTLFAHGGLSVQDAALGLEELNEVIRLELRAYLELRDELFALGVLNPLLQFEEQAGWARGLLMAVEKRREEAAAAGGRFEDPSWLPQVTRYIETIDDAPFLREDSPFWNRDLAYSDDAAIGPLAAAVLRAAGAERIVVGHTPMKDGRIRERADGRVYLIDTGMSPFYDGRPSALQIRGDEVRALYLDSVDELGPDPGRPVELGALPEEAAAAAE
jgi:hypothetical protein